MPLGSGGESQVVSNLLFRVADDYFFTWLQDNMEVIRQEITKLGIYYGTGSPETVVVAPVGSIYKRLDGGAGTTLYVKESGVAATGWVAK